MKSGAKQVSKKSTGVKKAPAKQPGRAGASAKSAPEAKAPKKGFVKSPAKSNIVAKPVVMSKPALAAQSGIKPGIKPGSNSGVTPKPNATSKSNAVAKGSAVTTVAAKTPKPVSKPKPPAAPLEHRPAPITSVPTNGKPRKNQAGLTWRELETFRALLLSKRHELVGDVFSMERDALHASGGSNLSNLPLHMADMGTDNYEQEFTLGLMEKDRKLLKEINLALAKIQDGRYGICEGTGQPISKVRLEAQPWARFSIDYARKMEHGGVGAGRVSRDFNRATDT